MDKFEINEKLQEKCLEAAIKLVADNNDCHDCHIVDNVAFCSNDEEIYAIIATPVEEFDDTLEHREKKRLEIEAAAAKYLVEHECYGMLVFTEVQVMVLGEHRGFARVAYNFCA